MRSFLSYVECVSIRNKMQNEICDNDTKLNNFNETLLLASFFFILVTTKMKCNTHTTTQMEQAQCVIDEMDFLADTPTGLIVCTA